MAITTTSTNGRPIATFSDQSGMTGYYTYYTTQSTVYIKNIYVGSINVTSVKQYINSKSVDVPVEIDGDLIHGQIQQETSHHGVKLVVGYIYHKINDHNAKYSSSVVDSPYEGAGRLNTSSDNVIYGLYIQPYNNAFTGITVDLYIKGQHTSFSLTTDKQKVILNGVTIGAWAGNNITLDISKYGLYLGQIGTHTITGYTLALFNINKVDSGSSTNSNSGPNLNPYSYDCAVITTTDGLQVTVPLYPNNVSIDIS